ncbi:hypothetical protein [Xanthomarina gelatinilytica]|uniref:hypothetical protein n=1 Tax=Xanthomarina gelatinilytica TaxID=1137281 RepID=UPI003AA849C2
MTYANHNLRTSLQEWKNRLARAPFDQFGNQLKYLLNNFKIIPQINGILQDLRDEFPYDDEELNKRLDQIHRSSLIIYESAEHQASYTYQFLDFFIRKTESFDIQRNMFYNYGDANETLNGILENYLTPIFNVLHDKLDKSSSVIYLLEKYKKRTEWFAKKELSSQYQNAKKSFEQILEDDLRLFLFDQGIEYPFSTPASASGRADIVGEIETDDPLVLEIKIFDREKNYGKDRIKEGFTQIIKYANDYNKNVGYLVIYNMDKAELNFNFAEQNNIFPPRIVFNNKTFYFITINSLDTKSASKSGKTEQIEITENELTDK